MTSVNISIFILLTTIFSICAAKRFTHAGPTEGQKIKVLHADILSDPMPAVDGSDKPTRHMMHMKTQVTGSFIIWDELKNDGVSMVACSRVKPNRRAWIILEGTDIEVDDFARNTILAIDKDHWKDECGKKVRSSRKISSKDNVLFFRIKKCVGKDGDRVKLRLVQVPRRAVCRKIEVFARLNDNLQSNLPPPITFDDEKEVAASRFFRSFSNETELPVTSHIGIEKTIAVEIGDSASVELKSSFSAGLSNFHIVLDTFFLIPQTLKCSWEQYMKASVSAEVNIEKKWEASTSKQLFKHHIHGLGVSAHIPLLGKVALGAFVKVDFVADIEAGLGGKVSLTTSYEKREILEINVLNGKLSSKLKHKSGSGDSSVSFDNEVGAKLVGFTGVRPAFGASMEFGSDPIVEANIGASLGLQASLHAKVPAFKPYTGGGAKRGDCHTCHFVQGALAVIGKNLNLLAKVEDEDFEEVLLENLFELRLGTLCAVPHRCGPPPTPSVTPTQTPTPSITPTPFPSPKKCPFTCRSDIDCPAFCDTETSYCKFFVYENSYCDECSVCVNSDCVDGTCKAKSPDLTRHPDIPGVPGAYPPEHPAGGVFNL